MSSCLWIGQTRLPRLHYCRNIVKRELDLRGGNAHTKTKRKDICFFNHPAQLAPVVIQATTTKRFTLASSHDSATVGSYFGPSFHSLPQRQSGTPRETSPVEHRSAWSCEAMLLMHKTTTTTMSAKSAPDEMITATMAEERFPVKLHAMLTALENEGQTTIASWLSHGYSFRVHDQERFMREILPTWFKQTKTTSFIRYWNDTLDVQRMIHLQHRPFSPTMYFTGF